MARAYEALWVRSSVGQRGSGVPPRLAHQRGELGTPSRRQRDAHPELGGKFTAMQVDGGFDEVGEVACGESAFSDRCDADDQSDRDRGPPPGTQYEVQDRPRCEASGGAESVPGRTKLTAYGVGDDEP